MNIENITLFIYIFFVRRIGDKLVFLFQCQFSCEKKSIQSYCHVFCKKEAMKIFYWQKEDCIINIRILIDKKNVKIQKYIVFVAWLFYIK